VHGPRQQQRGAGARRCREQRQEEKPQRSSVVTKWRSALLIKTSFQAEKKKTLVRKVYQGKGIEKWPRAPTTKSGLYIINKMYKKLS